MSEFNNFGNELANKIKPVFMWFSDSWNMIYQFFSDSVHQFIIALFISSLLSLLGIYVAFTRQSPSKEHLYETFREQNILLKEENEILSTYIIQSFEALYKKQKSRELSAREIHVALSSLKKGDTEKAEEIFQNLLDEACEQDNILGASKAIQTIISLLILKGNQNEALSYYEIMVEQYPALKEQNRLQPSIYQILEKYAVKYPILEGGNIDLSRISKELFNWILTHLEMHPDSSYVKFTIGGSIGREPENTKAIVPNPGCQIFCNGQIIAQYQIKSDKNDNYSKAYTYYDLLKEQRVIAKHWLLNIEKWEKGKH